MCIYSYVYHYLCFLHGDGRGGSGNVAVDTMIAFATVLYYPKPGCFKYNTHLPTPAFADKIILCNKIIADLGGLVSSILGRARISLGNLSCIP